MIQVDCKLEGMNNMHITGGCFCREIEYEAEIDENLIGICHCRDCQILSGAPYRMSTGLPLGNLKVTKGTPNRFSKVADSGATRVMAFCGTCGTHLFAEPADPNAQNAFVSIRLASADQFADLKPTGEIYCQSRVPWLSAMEGLAQFELMPGMDAEAEER